MEQIFHTSPKPPTRSDVGPATTLSAVAPWSSEVEKNAGIHNPMAYETRRPTTNGGGYAPVRRLDNSLIEARVIMAQRLSRQQEKNFHFIIQRYRLLCNRLVEAARNLDAQVFLMTSALAEEGKTLTTANLAFALSGVEQKRTLLIDLDLRRFALHSIMGLSTGAGEHFLHVEDWRKCLWSVRPGLDALLATRPADRPDEMLHSASLRNLLDAARLEYDYILIDSAPLLLAADTHALLPVIDQALLVVRADHTPIFCSQDALKILGDKAVGCILNDVKRLKYESYYRGYYGTDD